MNIPTILATSATGLSAINLHNPSSSSENKLLIKLSVVVDNDLLIRWITRVSKYLPSIIGIRCRCIFIACIGKMNFFEWHLFITQW